MTLLRSCSALRGRGWHHSGLSPASATREGKTVNDNILAEAIEALEHAEHLVDIQTIVRIAARRVVDADGATFVLRDGEQCFYADEDAMSPLWKGQRFPLTQCVSGWAMLNHEVAAITDITADPRVPLDAYLPTFVRSLVMVPVGLDASVAAIGAYWSGRHAATDDERRRLVALADATATALERVGVADAPFVPSLR